MLAVFSLFLLTAVITFRNFKRKVVTRRADLTLEVLSLANAERFRAPVMELNKLTFGGHDWIAEAFPEWCTSTDVNHVLGLFDVKTGRLAALEVVRRYSDSIGCVEALRVHPYFRQQGLAHEMQRCLLEYARKRTPLKLLTYTTYDKNLKSIAVADASGFRCVEKFYYVMVAEQIYGEGEDTIWMTYQGTALSHYLAKLQRVRCSHNVSPPPSPLEELRDGQKTRHILKQAGVKVVLLSWKPVFVDDVHVNVLPSGPHSVLTSDVGMSLGVVYAAGARAQYVLKSPPHNTTTTLMPAFLDMLTHMEEWIRRTMEVKASGWWFAYPEELRELMVKHDLDLKEPRFEALYELRL